jgi:hypothetical protein
VKKLQLSLAAGGNVKLHNPLWKVGWQFAKELNIYLHRILLLNA